jgi:hypothetical protein
MLNTFKRALGLEQRAAPQECYALLLLAEAIVDYGRMIHAYEELSTPEVTVEIHEVARRFRETPQTIEDALCLLSDSGGAEPMDLRGFWKLSLAHPIAREGLPAA